LIAALLLAAAVPASASGALVVEDASGLRALLQSAGEYSPSFSPEAMGSLLRGMIGIDLFAEQPEWGLGKGARALVFTREATGISAPVKNRKSARRAMEAWRKGAANRAGAISARRVLLASGRDAGALVRSMAHPRPLPKALSARARGPAWLWLRFEPPLKSAVFTLDASAAGLVARGLVLPARKAALLDGAPPAPCESPAGCVRASLGPAGREMLAYALRLAGRPAPDGVERLSARIDGFDLEQLTDERSIPRAVLWSISYGGPPASGPALEGRLDWADIDKELSKLSPLDALRGSAAAGACAAHFIYGSLLRHTGPLTVIGRPAGDGAEVEVRLPIAPPSR
jgi:hypothetical protein